MDPYWKQVNSWTNWHRKKTDRDVQAPLVALRAASAQSRTHGGTWLVLVGALALPVVVGVWAWTPAARRVARTTKLALNNMA